MLENDSTRSISVCYGSIIWSRSRELKVSRRADHGLRLGSLASTPSELYKTVTPNFPTVFRNDWLRRMGPRRDRYFNQGPAEVPLWSGWGLSSEEDERICPQEDHRDNTPAGATRVPPWDEWGFSSVEDKRRCSQEDDRASRPAGAAMIPPWSAWGVSSNQPHRAVSGGDQKPAGAAEMDPWSGWQLPSSSPHSCNSHRPAVSGGDQTSGFGNSDPLSVLVFPFVQIEQEEAEREERDLAHFLASLKHDYKRGCPTCDSPSTVDLMCRHCDLHLKNVHLVRYCFKHPSEVSTNKSCSHIYYSHYSHIIPCSIIIYAM